MLGVGAVGTLSGVTSISVGTATACAVVSGAADCWGWGDLGQLGNGGTSDSSTPKAVSAPATSGVTSIATGDHQTCAVINGAVDCWGQNGDGEVGDGTTSQRNSPVSVIAPGTVSGSTTLLTGVSSAAFESLTVGSHVSCARLASGQLDCWGRNQEGEIGDGGGCWNCGGGNSSYTNSSAPLYVNGAGPTFWSSTGVSVSEEQGNTNTHSSAATSVGGVRCWGYDGNGQLGNATTNSNVNSFPLNVTLSTAAGANPVVPTNLAGPVVATAGSHSCVIFNSATITGGVQCWGANGDGELGNNSTTQSSSPVVVQNVGHTAALSGVTAIAAGGFNSTQGTTCAVVSGGVDCWGDNSNGQVGDNSTTNRTSPVVTIAAGSPSAVNVSVGDQLACALMSDSTMRCWGDNPFGAIGDGTTNQRNAPVTVLTSASGHPALTGVTSIAAGYVATSAVVSGGVDCWGGAGQGQLGNNSTSNQSYPVSATGLGAGPERRPWPPATSTRAPS